MQWSSIPDALGSEARAWERIRVLLRYGCRAIDLHLVFTSLEPWASETKWKNGARYHDILADSTTFSNRHGSS